MRENQRLQCGLKNCLPECIDSSVLESQLLPHKIVNLSFKISNQILSWRFCGGVYFLKLINIVSDKVGHREPLAPSEWRAFQTYLT